jgi:hypothetical protein
MSKKDESYYDLDRNHDPKRGMKMTFCSTCRTCPSIDIHKDLNNVVLGGKEEGFSVWTKDQFNEFVEEIKKGTFDEYI